MTIGQRIKGAREERNMTLDELSRFVGVTRQTLSRYETGVIESIPSDKIEAIALALSVTPAYLMGWENSRGEVDVVLAALELSKQRGISYEEAESLVNIYSTPGILPLPRTVKKPRLGVIACGEPILAVENLDGYDDVPENIHCDFTLICKGDSMIGARIHDGDVVYIRQQPEVENGEIAAVLLDGTETTLKRVYHTDGMVTLQAENPAFAPIVVTAERQFAVLGKAVGFTSIIK